jgi:hypothetical protein
LPKHRQIDSDELANTPQRVCDLAVDLIRSPVDEPRREIGDQRLELKSSLDSLAGRPSPAERVPLQFSLQCRRNFNLLKRIVRAAVIAASRSQDLASTTHYSPLFSSSRHRLPRVIGALKKPNALPGSVGRGCCGFKP